MIQSTEEDFLQSSITELRKLKTLAEKSVHQMSDETFFALPDEESNSVAIVMKHLGGNMRSRWTDFLSSDGEKPDRDRDSEFVTEGDTKETVLELWKTGWSCLFDTLQSLSADDLNRQVRIREIPHSVPQAIQRTFRHCAYHVGQIVYLAKHYCGDRWNSLSVPKNRSPR